MGEGTDATNRPPWTASTTLSSAIRHACAGSAARSASASDDLPLPDASAD